MYKIILCSVSSFISSSFITASVSSCTCTPFDINTEGNSNYNTIYIIMMIIITIIGLSAPISAGITLAISIPVSSIISSLLTILVVYLCCGKSKGDYSISTTSPVYETPLPGSNITRTSEFEMKGNQAYGHVTSATRSTSEYETVTS